MKKVAFCLEFEEWVGFEGSVEDAGILCAEVSVFWRDSVVQLMVWAVIGLESGKTGLNAGCAICLNFDFFICKMGPVTSALQGYEN